MKKDIGYIDVYDHPLACSLRNNYKDILQEYQDVLYSQKKSKTNNVMGVQKDQGTSNGKQLYVGKIDSVSTHIAEESCSKSEYELFWGKTQSSYDEANKRLESRRKSTPLLEDILKPYSKHIGTVLFNYMHPPAKLNQHYGMIDKYIRFHLGLISDPGAKFYVNDLPGRAWENGKVWAFDDGLSYHGTTHTGKNARLILIIDFNKEGFGEIREESKWG